MSHFPVREKTIPERIAISKPWATFSNYVGYIRKAGFFSQEPLLYDTAAVKSIIAAPKLEGKGKYRFPNFIQTDTVGEILKHGPRDSPFAKLAYISFLYAIRVPSEALLLRRAYRNDELANFAPMKALALTAIRGEMPNERLAIRFLLRANLPQGCILTRPCFCALSRSQDRNLCPVHAIWPAIAARVKPGELRFPGYYGTNVNAKIKAALAKIHATIRSKLHISWLSQRSSARIEGKGITMVRSGRRRRMAAPGI